VIHNINVYRSTGEPQRVRVFTFAADDTCNLPDGCQILHVEQLYDDNGDYIQLWASVPEASELARETRVMHEVEDDVPASDPDGRLKEDFGTDDDEEDDGGLFKT
jgi:hypothetical protein